MKLHIHNSNIIGNIKTSNLLQVVAICMFTFCDCLTRNKTKKHKQILDSAQYGLEIIFNFKLNKEEGSAKRPRGEEWILNK